MTAEAAAESSSGPSKSKRSRSRTGCYTCRRRKKLCDNARPTCGSCNRFGIPCVFPKLYLAENGDWVPSPQPNGRKRRASEDQGAAKNGIPWAPAWDADLQSMQSLTSQPTSQNSIPRLPETKITPTHPSLAATSIAGPSRAAQTSPFAAPSSSGKPPEGFEFLDDWLQNLAPSEASPSLPDVGSIQPTQAEATSGLDLEGMYQVLGGLLSSHDPPDAMTHLALHGHPITLPPPTAQQAAGITEHLPVLLEYFITSFSHIASVLGPDDNSLLDHLLPLACRSQLVLYALAGWAASYLSILGEQYVGIANSAVAHVEREVRNIGQIHDMSDEQKEEAMMALLILGNIEVCRGDVRGWVGRLPTTRQILRAATAQTDVSVSSTWRGLALNLVYHDILSSLATCRDCSLPLDFYTQILSASEAAPDVYMGVTMRIFGVLGEIILLANEISTILSLPSPPEAQRQLHRVLPKHEALLSHLRTIEVPASAYAHEKTHLITAFQTLKLATELYLRQTVLHAATSDLASRSLADRTLQHMRLVVGTPSESQMLFPLFVVGVNSSDKDRRSEVSALFNRFSERVKAANIQACFSLLLEVWKRDPNGDRFVHWRKIADESEVCISFA